MEQKHYPIRLLIVLGIAAANQHKKVRSGEMMARHWLLSIAFCAGLLIQACGKNDAATSPAAVLDTDVPSRASPTSEGDQMRPKPTPSDSQSSPSSTASAAHAQPATPATAATPSAALSQTAIEDLVTSDLATLLKLPAGQIQINSTVARTWNDQGLGCARKGLYEPAPTPGYELTLTSNGQTFRYHTDLHGRIIRCIESSKRLGPISR